MLLQANAQHIPLADESVHMCVTSPPYFSLRDYGTATWAGGDANCGHWAPARGGTGEASALQVKVKRQDFQSGGQYRDVCADCGATRTDHQLGLEALHDCLAWARSEPPCGKCYVCQMRRVFAEVYRVMRDDATLFLNLGDSYNAYNGNRGTNSTCAGQREMREPDFPTGHGLAVKGLKPKDMMGIPWRVALALQADGFYLRSDIIWSKPNPMPESVTDRPTKAHEYLFLLSKNARYFYDAEAVREPHQDKNVVDGKYQGNGGVNRKEWEPNTQGWNGGGLKMGDREYNPAGRNRRTVWEIPTAPYSGAHFATYPPALVEPCILAGTSAAGNCSVCGAPWERVTEREPNKMGIFGGEHRETKRNGALGKRDRDPEREKRIGQSNTTGWRPTCAHDAATVPGIVLDPFAGSGTTGQVARLHGRRFVGLDISREYLATLALPRAEGKQTAASLATLPLFAAAGA